jgi:hypothetical protein
LRGLEKEGKGRGDILRTKRLMRKSVFMLGLFALLSILCSFFLIGAYVRGAAGASPLSAMECTAFPKLYSSLYVWGSCALLEFLRVRSDLVAGITESSIAMKYLRIVANLAAKAVFLCGFLCLILWNGEIMPDTDGNLFCVDSINVIVVVCFAASTAPVNVCFVLLFVWPIYHHYRTMKNVRSSMNAKSNGLLRVLKRNIILSTIGLMSTLAMMINMAVTSGFYHYEHDRLIMGNGFADLDLTVNLICMCLMFNQWIPLPLRNRLCPRTSVKDRSAPREENAPPKARKEKVPSSAEEQKCPAPSAPMVFLSSDGTNSVPLSPPISLLTLT